MAQRELRQQVITCDYQVADKQAPRGVFRCPNKHVTEMDFHQARMSAKLDGWHVCPHSAMDVNALVDLCPEHRKERGL